MCLTPFKSCKSFCCSTNVKYKTHLLCNVDVMCVYVMWTWCLVSMMDPLCLNWAVIYYVFFAVCIFLVTDLICLYVWMLVCLSASINLLLPKQTFPHPCLCFSQLACRFFYAFASHVSWTLLCFRSACFPFFFSIFFQSVWSLSAWDATDATSVLRCVWRSIYFYPFNKNWIHETHSVSVLSHRKTHLMPNTEKASAKCNSLGEPRESLFEHLGFYIWNPKTRSPTIS